MIIIRYKQILPVQIIATLQKTSGGNVDGGGQKWLEL
jgi:hypothetical protein